MSDFKVFIEKQIIKTTVDIIRFVDQANSISESLDADPELRKIKDKMKDSIEEKTGIHIDRSYETKTGYILDDKDPDFISYQNYYEKNQDKIDMERKLADERYKREERNALIFGLLGGSVFVYLFIKSILFILKVVV